MENPHHLDKEFNEGENPLIELAMQFVFVAAFVAASYALYCGIVLTMPLG